MNKLLKILSCLALAAGVASCGGSKEKDARPTVAVSIEPQGYLLGEIVGDKMNVVTMLPTYADPENFEPTMKLLSGLNDSQIYFAVGNMPFEEQLLEKSGVRENGHTKIISAEGLQDITNTHSHGDHSHEAKDPHVWTSLANCRAMAKQMLEAVSEADAANAGLYKRNYQALEQRLDSLESVWGERLKASEGDVVMVQHPSLSYFARDYGLRQMYMGMENKEFTPNSLRALIDSVRGQSRAATMVSEAAYNAERARSIADGAGARVVEINTLGRNFIQELDSLTIILAQTHDQHNRADK